MARTPPTWVSYRTHYDARIVYALVDPRAPTRYRYVGCTRLQLRQRLANHLGWAKTRHKRRQPVHLWMHRLLCDGFEPGIVPLEIAHPCSDRERDWVRRLISEGHDLFNVRLRPKVAASA